MTRLTLVAVLLFAAIFARLSYKIGEARGYNDGIRKIQPEPARRLGDDR